MGSSSKRQNRNEAFFGVCFFGRCAAGYWGEEESGSPSLDKPIKSEDGACGGENSTESCCGTFGYMKERRAACVEDFKCTNDPCKVRRGLHIHVHLRHRGSYVFRS